MWVDPEPPSLYRPTQGQPRPTLRQRFKWLVTTCAAVAVTLGTMLFMLNWAMDLLSSR